MNIDDRIVRYRAIEDYRGRPLIAYVTSTRPGVRALIGGDVVPEFIDQVEAIGAGEAVDVLLHSMGGDALAAWKVMSILRERFKRVTVLVPFAAFSAATVFALGADEIVMHPYASLGPIDPQITVRLPDGTGRQFAYEDLVAFLGFMRDDMKLTDQAHVTSVVERLFAAIDPLVVGAAKRASELSAAVGERMLRMHMQDDRRARQIAVNLNKSFFAHGDAVSRPRAMELELPVAKSDPRLEKLLWDAYLGIEEYAALRSPFTHMATFLSDPQAAASIRLPAPLLLPANTPPQLMQQVWQSAAQQSLQAAQGAAIEVPYTIVTGLVESTRMAAEQRLEGKLSAFRQPTADVKLIMTEIGTGWIKVPVAPAVAPTGTP